MSFAIVPAWKRVTPGLEQELVAFWRDHDAILDPALAQHRAAQAVCIVRDADDALRGVATAVVRVLPRLRQPLYYYRMFFAPALRGHQQFLPVYRCAKRILQDYNASLEQPESIGLLLELENDKLGKAYPHAYEPEFGATFIGYSPRGLQLRAAYFAGVELLPPASFAALPPPGVAAGASAG